MCKNDIKASILMFTLQRKLFLYVLQYLNINYSFVCHLSSVVNVWKTSVSITFCSPPPFLFFCLFFLIKMTACNWEAGDRSRVFISQIEKNRLSDALPLSPVGRLRGHCKLPASQFKEEIICPWASLRIFIWLSCLLDESCTLNCLCLSPVFTRKRYIRPVCLSSTCSWMSYYHVTLI